jgi:hypothetical protein
VEEAVSVFERQNCSAIQVRDQGSGPAGGQRLIQKDRAATVNTLPQDMTAAGPKREWPRIKGGWCELPGGVLAGSPPHPKGAQDKGAEEHGNADEQQV